MAYLFYLATAFDQYLDNWDVSNVTNMYYMFTGAVSFNQTLNSWNVTNVTNMTRCFKMLLRLIKTLALGTHQSCGYDGHVSRGYV